MTGRSAGARGPRDAFRVLAIAAVAVAVAAALIVLLLAVTRTPPATAVTGPSGSAPVAVAAPPSPSPTPTPSPTATWTPRPTPVRAPSPIPSPTPVLVPAPLTGELVSPEAARQHVVGIMIDDLRAARPQDGLSQADVVWQAPAEAGIPRYLALFQSEMPTEVGPIRSARQYFIAWASEWDAMYVHVGGSPQALATLRSKGQGQLVYNADEFRYGGKYLYRIRDRAAPHNVYSNGEKLRALAKVVGAKDGELEPAWTFGSAPGERPVGGSIDVAYPYNEIHYAYDNRSNRYRRSVTGESRQTDAETGERIAPRNVVILVVRFGQLAGSANAAKHRLEAQYVGSGKAWIATNGTTVEGTWRKADDDAPTLLFDADGKPVTLTVGQTFVQVVPSAGYVTIEHGVAPVPVVLPDVPGVERQ